MSSFIQYIFVFARYGKIISFFVSIGEIEGHIYGEEDRDVEGDVDGEGHGDKYRAKGMYRGKKYRYTMDEGSERDKTWGRGGLPTLPGLYHSTIQPLRRGFF
jgi:hypothetical protein